MPVYSHSRLSSYEKCPLQYRYRYIDRIKRDTQGIEAFMGQRVHEALERLYRAVAAGRRPPLDALLADYRKSFTDAYSDNVRIVRTGQTAEHYLGVGAACLTNYYRGHEPFESDATVGLEERVEVSLDGEARYRIQGYIDRLARPAPGVYAIHDYKTSGSLPKDRDLREDRQLTLYQMAVQARYPDARDVRLIWHYLVFGRDLTATRSGPEIESHRARAMRLIDTIEAARDFPPRESPLCRWCEYRDICPVQKDKFAAEREAAAIRSAAAAPAPKSEAARTEQWPAGRPSRQLDLFS